MMNIFLKSMLLSFSFMSLIFGAASTDMMEKEFVSTNGVAAVAKHFFYRRSPGTELISCTAVLWGSFSESSPEFQRFLLQSSLESCDKQLYKTIKKNLIRVLQHTDSLNELALSLPLGILRFFYDKHKHIQKLHVTIAPHPNGAFYPLGDLSQLPRSSFIQRVYQDHACRQAALWQANAQAMLERKQEPEQAEIEQLLREELLEKCGKTRI